jgi:hypothetical protein
MRDRVDLKTMQATAPWEWPESAGRTLLEVLRDKRAKASDRLAAVEMAGETVVINDELADVLLSIVSSGDQPESLRARAAISLGPALEEAELDGFEDPDDVPISQGMFEIIQRSFWELYEDTEVPKEVRRRVLEASVRSPQDWHREAIRTAFSSPDDEWKLTAVFAMQYARGFDDQILEMLDSENPEIRYEAVCAAGNWELDAAWPYIEELVMNRSTEKHLLLAAIEAAAKIRPREAGPLLVDLTDSDDEDIVEAADEAMAMAQEELRAQAEEDEDEDEDLDEEEDSDEEEDLDEEEEEDEDSRV